MKFQSDIKHNISGFTLIEMSIVLVIAGIILSTIMTVLPSILRTSKIKETRALLAKYDSALQGYAINNSKLPFADSTGDGVEDSGFFIGTLPYVTLGLSNGNDAWGHIVKYAVYGSAGNPNNLTDTTNKTALCTALSNIAAIEATPGYTYNSNIVYTTPSNNCNDTLSKNKAYVIASGGAKDLDTNNDFFDLCNGTSGAGFNAENKIQALNYDDIVRSFSLNELTHEIGCP